MEQIPVIIALIFVPLMMRMKEVHVEYDYYSVWTTQHVYMDFFSYYKMWVLLFCTFFALILLINRVLMEKGMDIQKKGLYYKLILGYALLVTFSTIGSRYMEVAYWGFLDRHEGMLTIIAYVFMFFYTFYIVDSMKDVKRIFIGLIIGAVGILLIGVFQ
jgi:hypothetical protein